jgi:L-alanine-DL-glutamate epimerase-like enolase superfamily enzyme
MKYKNYSLKYEKKSFKLKENFKISRGSKSKINSIILTLNLEKFEGVGECTPYKRYNETTKQIFNFLKKNKKISNLNKIPYFSLRKAISDAIYDIKLQQEKVSFLKIIKKKKFQTLITIPITSKQKFINKIKKLKNIKNIKIKLNQKNIFEYLDIIKKNNSKTEIIIDANEGWNINFFKRNETRLKNYKIKFIEQPFKATKNFKINSYIPLCADESFHINNQFNKLVEKYRWVNIKPDKFGDDVEVIKAIKFAKKNKFKILLGCMVSSSQSIIPTLRYAKYCDLLDLDGAMFLKNDFKNGLTYKLDNLYYDKKFKFGYTK